MQERCRPTTNENFSCNVCTQIGINVHVSSFTRFRLGGGRITKAQSARFFDTRNIDKGAPPGYAYDSESAKKCMEAHVNFVFTKAHIGSVKCQLK